MNSTKYIGIRAAQLSLLFSVCYSLLQIASLLLWIKQPYNLVGMFIPSLLLAPSFLTVMASLHLLASEDRKIYSMAGLSFALLYAAIVTLVYFTQLASVIPMQLRKEIIGNQLLFEGTSFMVAADCIGYGFMSLATLFTAFAYKGPGYPMWLHRGLLLHGLLAPFVIASFFFPFLLAVGALWMITFPVAMIQVIRWMKQPARQTPAEQDQSPAVSVREVTVVYDD